MWDPELFFQGSSSCSGKRECEWRDDGEIFLRGMNETFFSRGVDSSPETRHPREWFACLRTVRAIHSNGRKKGRKGMKTATDGFGE